MRLILTSSLAVHRVCCVYVACLRLLKSSVQGLDLN